MRCTAMNYSCNDSPMRSKAYLPKSITSQQFTLSICSLEIANHCSSRCEKGHGELQWLKVTSSVANKQVFVANFGIRISPRAFPFSGFEFEWCVKMWLMIRASALVSSTLKNHDRVCTLPWHRLPDVPWWDDTRTDRSFRDQLMWPLSPLQCHQSFTAATLEMCLPESPPYNKGGWGKKVGCMRH